MYAVVKTGGRQYRVAVGDVLEVGTLDGQRGDTVTLPAVLFVDGETVTSQAAELAGVSVTGEVVEHTKGPKIRILKYKNKTGYRKRQGHRQRLTRVKVTGIDANSIDANSIDPNSIDTNEAAGGGSTAATASATTASDPNETGK